MSDQTVKTLTCKRLFSKYLLSGHIGFECHRCELVFTQEIVILTRSLGLKDSGPRPLCLYVSRTALVWLMFLLESPAGTIMAPEFDHAMRCLAPNSQNSIFLFPCLYLFCLAIPCILVVMLSQFLQVWTRCFTGDFFFGGQTKGRPMLVIVFRWSPGNLGQLSWLARCR